MESKVNRVGKYAKSMHSFAPLQTFNVTFMQGCCTAKSFLVDNLDRNHLHNLLKCSLHTELA